MESHELRNIAKAARDSGLSREGRRELIENPPKEWTKDKIDPKLASGLNTEVIADVFQAYAGEEFNRQRLFSLANLLYDKQSSQEPLTNDEASLLSIGSGNV